MKNDYLKDVNLRNVHLKNVYLKNVSLRNVYMKNVILKYAYMENVEDKLVWKLLLPYSTSLHVSGFHCGSRSFSRTGPIHAEFPSWYLHPLPFRWKLLFVWGAGLSPPKSTIPVTLGDAQWRPVTHLWHKKKFGNS